MWENVPSHLLYVSKKVMGFFLMGVRIRIRIRIRIRRDPNYMVLHLHIYHVSQNGAIFFYWVGTNFILLRSLTRDYIIKFNCLDMGRPYFPKYYTNLSYQTMPPCLLDQNLT